MKNAALPDPDGCDVAHREALTPGPRAEGDPGLPAGTPMGARA